MFDILLKQFNIDPATFKKNFELAFVRVENAEKQIVEIRTDIKFLNAKIDLLLQHEGFDVSKINRDMVDIRNVRTPMLTPPDIEFGNA